MTLATLVALAALSAASALEPPAGIARQGTPETAASPAPPRPTSCTGAPAKSAEPGAAAGEGPAPRFCALKPRVKPPASAVPSLGPAQGATK